MNRPDQQSSHGRFDIAVLTRILTEATGIVTSLRQQTQSLQRRAYTDGYAAGFEKAQAETVRQALEAQLKAREFVDASGQQIISMALACMERVASELGPTAVLEALLTDALEAIKAERRLRVSVSRTAAKATREMLARWQQEHPQVVVEVLVDPQLDPFCCKIESELGCIELGLRKQLEAMREGPGAGASAREAPAGDVDRAGKSGWK